MKPKGRKWGGRWPPTTASRGSQQRVPPPLAFHALALCQEQARLLTPNYSISAAERVGEQLQLWDDGDVTPHPWYQWNKHRLCNPRVQLGVYLFQNPPWGSQHLCYGCR